MPPLGTKVVGPRKLPEMTPELETLIREYWSRGLRDKEIHERLLQKHIDTSRYSLSYQSFRKLRKDLGLLGVRQQNHSVETLHPVMMDLRERHPNSGVSDTRHLLRVESLGGNLRVPRSVIQEWSRLHEPEKVLARQSQVIPRKPFICAGVNEIWAVDQHDKWKFYGLWLHVCVDNYSGLIIWMNVWWTNSNPRLICGYFLDAIERASHQGMPMLTQSDPGTEKYGIANAQSTLRQMLDPSLQGMMQHIHSKKHGNKKPEVAWAGLRRRFAPAITELLSQGVEQGIYDPHIHVQFLVFRFVFMPLIQRELDLYVTLVNSSPRRSSRKSVLPNDAPLNIYEWPEKYGAKDFRIPVPPEALSHVRQLYAPPNDPVFEFLPHEFAEHVNELHQAVGGEPIERANAWFYYQGIVAHFVNYELSMLGQQQVLYQGNLYQMLLEQSDTGAARGNMWGYDLQLLGPVEEWNNGANGLDDIDAMGELDIGELSGDEDIEGNGPGCDW